MINKMVLLRSRLLTSGKSMHGTVQCLNLESTILFLLKSLHRIFDELKCLQTEINR